MNTRKITLPLFDVNYKDLTKSQKKIGTLLVFSLLAVSGVDFFFRSQIYIFIAFIFSLIAFFKYKLKLDIYFFRITLVFFIVETFQYLLFGGFNIRTLSGTYIRLFLAYAVVCVTKRNFFKFYVNILYFLSVISLVFYFCSFLPGAESFYKNVLEHLVKDPFNEDDMGRPDIVFFTFERSLYESARNSGPFWEPGAFAVYLMIALLFNFNDDKKILSSKNLVFIICLVSTFSTAGYIALFIFLIYVNFDLIKKNALYYLVFFMVISIGYFIYFNTEFMGDKIKNNIEISDETTTSRFGSALADIEDFKRSPVFGLGRAGAKENFAKELTIENHRNNGIFNLLAIYGLPITIMYFGLIFQSFVSMRKTYNLNNYFPIIALIIISILGFSQGIFLKPFMYSFLFIPSILIKKAYRIGG